MEHMILMRTPYFLSMEMLALYACQNPLVQRGTDTVNIPPTSFRGLLLWSASKVVASDRCAEYSQNGG